MKLPSSIGSFIILIANEAHESWQDERHKLITEKNSYYIPKNLVVPQGTTLSFLNADAPRDNVYV
jgi:ABC-type oligopeptide transport system substrate-binding subunit